MDKYFITGATGFIGTHLRERLKGSKYLFGRGQDISVISKYRPDYIYHLAAEIYDSKSMFESNIKLTYDLLEEAKNLPNLKAMIVIGSSSEYGRKDHPTKETDFLDPLTMYEATKGASTLLCQTYARTYGVPVVVARPYSLYGKHEPDKRFIPTIIRKIKNRQELQVAPGVHDFIHIDDFIDGLFLLEKSPHPGEIYNFGSGVQTTNGGLVSLIESVMGREANKVVVDRLHDYDSSCWVSDSAKARSIGWKPKYGLTEGLTQVITNIKSPKDNNPTF